MAVLVSPVLEELLAACLIAVDELGRRAMLEAITWSLQPLSAGWAALQTATVKAPNAANASIAVDGSACHDPRPWKLVVAQQHGQAHGSSIGVNINSSH